MFKYNELTFQAYYQSKQRQQNAHNVTGRLNISDGLLHCVLEIFMLRKNASSCFEADKTKGLIAKASGRLKVGLPQAFRRPVIYFTLFQHQTPQPKNNL